MGKKTPQQRQYEQVKDKLTSLLQEIDKTLELMPTKGDTQNECQKTFIKQVLSHLGGCINGICLEDFTPNEHSTGFQLSYS